VMNLTSFFSISVMFYFVFFFELWILLIFYSLLWFILFSFFEWWILDFVLCYVRFFFSVMFSV
jgi:hypothetical protein